MRVLLDTCTIAELKKPKPDAGVVAAVRAVPDGDLFLSSLSIGEITRGVELLPAGKRRNELSSWLGALEGEFSDRILPIDGFIARMWGETTASAQKKGIVIPPVDGLIAATAVRHRLCVMTRNEKDFKASGVDVLNPWRS